MQQAYTFDKETVRNIIRGAGHALLVAAALGLLEYLAQVAGAVKTDNVAVTVALSWFSGAGYNAIRQFIKGV